MSQTPDDQEKASSDVSRRRWLGLASAGVAGTALGAAAVAGSAIGAGSTVAVKRLSGERPLDDIVPFHGAHQAGIATSVPAHLHFASFDLLVKDVDGLRGLLRDWTAAARQMSRGEEVGPTGATRGHPTAPPDDTGEALELPAARLTLTIGFGASMFDNRFGLATRRPAALIDIPRFPGDALNPARCGGDIAIQACSDNLQVSVHAIRQFARIALGRAAVRWAQLGYGKASSTNKNEPTPRNLFGFKDGTNNPAGNDEKAMNDFVWVQPEDVAADANTAWMTGGSYMVARRINMHIETWDRTGLREQEEIIGRDKMEGAPLGSKKERDDVDVKALPGRSHVALSHPSRYNNIAMLRRGFNFVDGSDGVGHLESGLFFISFNRDPRKTFIPVQTALAASDRLNEYIRHTGSGIWAVPPGVKDEKGYWGETLLR